MPFGELQTVTRLCYVRAKRFVWDTHGTEATLCCFVALALLYILPSYCVVLLAWFLSGVISSIGFGCGVSTGLLYLIPYYVQFTLDHPEMGVFAAWASVLPACVAHAVGSSVGELPCYIMANRLVQRLEPGTVLMQTHEWTVRYVKRWGTAVVFLFALWPNAVFDMAGMAAGICNIPIERFFAATVLGKAVFKSPTIAFLVVATTKGEILPGAVQRQLDLLLNNESTTMGNAWFVGVTCITLYMVFQMMKEFAEEEKQRED